MPWGLLDRGTGFEVERSDRSAGIDTEVTRVLTDATVAPNEYRAADAAVRSIALVELCRRLFGFPTRVVGPRADSSFVPDYVVMW
jgi:hypothetical protein